MPGVQDKLLEKVIPRSLFVPNMLRTKRDKLDIFYEEKAIEKRIDGKRPRGRRLAMLNKLKNNMVIYKDEKKN